MNEWNLQSQKQGQWWCIYFGQEALDNGKAKCLSILFKRVACQVVFGHKRVFLNLGQGPWRNALDRFQRKLFKIAKKNGLQPETWQWGQGKSLAESWVQARWRTLSPDLLPIEVISDYLHPQEVHRKSPDESRKFRLLRSLGINSLQDLIDVPEDVLLSRCGVWIAEFCREYFSRPDEMRDLWLEKATTEALFSSHRPFQLEDWIPEEYLAVS